MALGSMGSGFNSWGDQKNKIVLITLFFIQPDGKSWECSKWGMLWGITLLKPYSKNTHVIGCFAITNRMRFFVSFTRKNNSCVGRWWLCFTNPLSFRYADLSRWNNRSSVLCYVHRQLPNSFSNQSSYLVHPTSVILYATVTFNPKPVVMTVALIQY